jgi:hypothetical protein
MADSIDHLDQSHPLADLMAAIEQVQACSCYDRTCDWCRARAARLPLRAPPR